MLRSPRHLVRSALAACAALALTLSWGCVGTLELDQVRPDGPTHRYFEVDGIRYHVEISGTGPPIILLHGFGGSTYSWRHVAPSLAESYRVIGVDLVGFGYTDRPVEASPYRRDEQVRRLVGLLDSLGEREATWIGHSYGGGIALALAAQHPERVRSLIVVDSVGPNYPIERRRPIARSQALSFAYIRGFGLRKWFVARVLRDIVHDEESVTPQVVEEYRERLRISGATRAFRHLSSPATEEEANKIIDLADISAPSLVIWGEHDPLMSTEVGQKGVEKMPNARPLIVIESTGHAPMEEEPARVANHILRFLTSQSEISTR